MVGLQGLTSTFKRLIGQQLGYDGLTRTPDRPVGPHGRQVEFSEASPEGREFSPGFRHAASQLGCIESVEAFVTFGDSVKNELCGRGIRFQAPRERAVQVARTDDFIVALADGVVNDVTQMRVRNAQVLARTTAQSKN